MSVHPTPLGAQIASLRKAGTAPPGADRRMLSKSLHALIAAIFARIFDRLEQILLLWQSGQLPAPPIRAPRAATLPRQHPAKPRRHRARQRIRTPLTKPQAPNRHRAPNPPATSAPFATTPSPVRPRPARDPPSRRRPRCFHNPVFRGRAAMRYIIRYRNN